MAILTGQSSVLCTSLASTAAKTSISNPTQRTQQFLKTCLVLFFVWVGFSTTALAQNCSVAAFTADNSSSYCTNETITLKATVGSTLSTSNPLWTQVSGPSVTIVSSTSTTTNLANFGAGSYTFRFSVTCQDGTRVSSDVSLTIYPITIANAGADRLACPGTMALSANAAGTGETGAWTIVGTNNAGLTIANASSPTSTITLPTTSAGATTLRWTITQTFPDGKKCTSFDDVIITNYGGVSPVTAGPDKTLNNCYSVTQTTTLNGSYAGNGTGGQIGTWVLVDGPNVPTIASPNSNTSQVSNLVEGTYTFRWTVAGPCVNGSALMKVVVPPPSSSVSSASATSLVFCDNRTTFTINGSNPIYAGENVLWTVKSKPTGSTVTLGSPNSPSTSVTVSTVGSYTFTYTITNPTTNCSTSADMTVSYQTPAAISITGSKVVTLACNVETTSIAYTASGGASTTYQIISGPTTIKGVFTSTGSPQAIAGLDTAGTYVIRFYRNIAAGANCSPAFDDITVIASRSAGNSVVGNAQFLKCGVKSTGLAANTLLAINGAGTWSQVSGPNTASIVNVSDPGTNVSGLIGGEYLFRWSVVNGLVCPPKSGDLKITVSENPNANAGDDQTVCYGVPAILSGSTPRGGETGTWSVVSQTPSGATPVFSNVNSKNSQVSNLQANTVYVFRWTVVGTSNLGGPDKCPDSFDDMTLTTTNSVGPTLANAGVDQCLPSGTTTFTLQGNAPGTGETGLWSIKSKPTGAPDPGFNPNTATQNAQLTGLQTGTYELYWTLTKNGCSHTDSLTITINSSTSTANAGIDQIICGTSTTLAATAISVGTGTWSQVSGPGGSIIASPNSNSSALTNLSPGVYVFRWTITNGACAAASFDDVQITASAAPSPANIVASSQSVCGTTTNGTALSTTLTADAITSGVGTWSLVGTSPSTPTFSDVNAASVTVSNLRTGNYKFRWTVTGGPGCTQSFDEIDVFVQEAAYAGADLTVCSPTSIALVGNGISGTWSNVAGSPVPTLTTAGATSANATNPAGATTPLPAGQYTFRYTIATNASATCPSTPKTDDVIYTVSPSGTTPNAGPDQNLCDATAFSLNANAASTGTGSWSALVVPSGGGGSFANVNNATTTYTPTGNKYGTFLLEWTITSGACVLKEQVRINNYQTPTVANAGADVLDACAPSIKMAGNTPTVGIGKWTQESGPTVTIVNPAQPTTQITGLESPNTYVFVWTITNGPTCPPSISKVTIKVPVPNPTPAAAGLDQNLCNATAAVLSGNTPTIGTGKWTIISGPYAVLSPQPPTNPNTTVLSMSPGTYKFEWETKNGSCVSKDTVVITNDAVPTAANAGQDIIMCNFDVVTLNANTPTSGTGKWTQVSKPTGAPDVIFVNPTSPTTVVNGTQLGTYVFRWTITTGGICQPSTDDVQVSILSQPTQANAGPNQTKCFNETVTLAGNTPSTGTGTWTKITGPGIVTFNNANLNNTTVTFSLPGTYTLRWSIGTGTCANFDEVDIIVRPIPTLSSAVGSCTGGVGTGKIVVTVSTTSGNNLEYALDNGTFQSSNTFLNLANGTYTVKVRDAVFTTCVVSTQVVINCSDNPVVGLAKSAGTPVKISTGVYDVPYTVLVKNLGNVALNNVQVADNLVTTFPAPATFTISTPVAAASPLSPNGSYNGNGNQNLLNAANSTLAIGQTGTITFTVRVSLNGSTQTIFNNQARGTAKGPNGTTTAPFDDSNNGGASNIDPNNNGNPSEIGENDPTPVTIQNTAIGLAKMAGTPVQVSDGVFDVLYTLQVKNLGNTDLSNVQVSDNLTNTFPVPVTFQVVSGSITSASPLQPNLSYNGSSDQNMLAQPSTLPAGATRSISFKVRISLNGSTQTTFNNRSTAVGTGPNNTQTSDLSNNGDASAIDPNQNGDPTETNENTPTPVTLSSAAIGVAKSVVGSPSLQSDGSYNVTYQVIVKNFGNVALNNVQVKDLMSDTYPSPATFTILSPGVSNITNAPDANGINYVGTNTSNANLLTGTGSLAVGASKTVQFTVNVKLNGSKGTNGIFYNSAEATGTPADGSPNVSDVSNNGNDPNPVGSIPTPVSLDTRADLSLQKSVSNTTPNVGDQVIYSIVVSNAGPNTATNVEIKDVLPAGVQFVSSSNLNFLNGTLTGAIASLPINGSTTLSFVAKITAPGVINNKAEVSKSDQGDPDSTPNSGTNDGQDDTDDAPLTAQQADLSLTKAVSKANPNVGETVSFSITVTNAGPSVATNVQVKDVLPAGLEFVASTNFVNNNGSLLSNNIASIGVNNSVILTFQAKVTSPGLITNRAEVSKSEQFDPDSTPNNGTNNNEDDTGGVALNGQQADLSLQKSVNDPTPNVGDELTYTIVVNNAGPSDATNVQVQDVLPAGLTFVSSSQFINTNGTLTASVASITANTSVTLTFKAKVTSGTPQTIVNKAEVSKSDQYDPDSKPGSGTEDGQDDTGSASITTQRADLSLTKVVSKTSPTVGETITFSISVNNAGPNTATNVQVKDVLPAGLEFVSSSDFSNAAGTLTASIASIASGQSKTVTFVAKVTQQGTITNRAEVSKSDQFDPDSTPNNGTNNNEDDTGGVILNGQQADLRLSKTVSKANPNVGEDITFTLTVTNDGPNTATNVEVKDVLPVGIAFVSSSTMTQNAGVLTGTAASIAPNSSVVFTFVGKVVVFNNFLPASITNKAEISKADQFDPDSQPNTGTEDGQDDTDKVTVFPLSADLSLTKAVSKTTPNVGETITYSITVANAGPAAATNVQVKDVLPAGLQFVSSTNFTNSNGTLLSNNIASITSGGSVVLTFQAKVLQAGSILNKAEISKADQFDPDSRPDNGTETGEDDTGGVLIGGQQADLSLTKMVSTANPNVGDVVEYTITVANAGPSTATNIEVKDVLPTGLLFSSSTDFQNANNTLTAAIASLASGSSKSLTFKAKVTKNGTFVNKAEISKADQFDPDSQPNTGTEDGQDDTAGASLTTQSADLSLTKAVNITSPSVGNTITFSISINNAGPDIATNVEVKDVLPTGLAFVSSTDFANNAGTLTATIPSLAAGATKTLTFQANVTAQGTIINQAEVSKSDQFDPDSTPGNGTNNSEDDRGGVVVNGQQADLSLKKEVSNTKPNVGETITYSITVSNAGPNVATNVEVKDVLPQGLQFVSSTNLTNLNGTLTGSTALLGVNQTLTFTFLAKVVGTSTIVNAAEVSKSDQFDPDSQPNSGTTDKQDDTGEASVTPLIADLSLIKTVSKANPNVGETITYSIKVTNDGPNDATNVQVKDVLPAGLQYAGSATNDFTENSGTLLSKNIALITQGGSVTLIFQAKVLQSGAIINKAEVSKVDQYDSDSQPNTGTEDGQDDTGGVLIGGQQADLSLSKAVSNASPNVNDEVTYTIEVKNAGPSNATGVQVKDVLPTGLSFVSSADFTNANGTLTASNLSIPNGGSLVLTFKAKVTQNGTIINKAEISKSDQFDPDSQPNSGTEDGQDDTGTASLKTQEADLSLQKLVNISAPSVGTTVTFSLLVNNAGPDVATNVQVKDVLPTGLQFVSSSDFVNTNGTLTAAIPSLAVSITKTLTFQAKVTQNGAIINRAEVSKSDQFDPDSTPNNGTNNNEDDNSGVALNGQQADLSLQKDVSNAKPNVGETVSFSITVSNDGPDVATNVEVKDVLPTGLTFVSSPTLVNNSGTITGVAASIPAKGSVTFIFTAKVTGTEPIVNKAEVSKSDQFDPDSQPNTGTEDKQDDTDDASLTPQIADLSLMKAVSKATPNVGETITYSITVMNDGPNDATNVQVKDVLPTGLQFVSSTDFTNSNGTLLSNNIAQITSGGKVVLTFQAKVLQAGSILNRAEVSKSDQFDPDSQPNTGVSDGQDDTGGVLIGGQQADLSLRKLVDNLLPNLNDVVTYTIEVKNAGPSPATNVAVKDVLPTGLTFVSSTDFTNTSGTLTAAIPSIATNGTVFLTFKAKISQVGTIVNKAEISKADQFDPDSQPNSGTEDGQDDTDDEALTVQQADLSLKKIASKTAVNVGDEVTYSIQISNAGPNIATNIQIQDLIPAGLQFVSSLDFTNNNGTLTAAIQSLGVGVTNTLSYKAKVIASGNISNKVQVTKVDQFDPDSTPNNGTDNGEDDASQVTVGGQLADLSLTKTVSSPTVNQNGNVTFTITVKNAGPSAATNVEVKDVLPAGLVFAGSTDFTQISTGTLTASIPTIAKDGSVNLTYIAKVTGTGTITNTAEVSKSDQPDPDSTPNNGTNNTEDDRAEASVRVLQADLSLAKAVSNASPNVGDNVTFTLTVSNAGSDAATNVQINDVLPSGLQFVSSTDFTNANGTLLSKTISSIAKDASVQLSFVAKVTQNGQIVNRAEVVASDQYDPDSQPNSGTLDGQDDVGVAVLSGQQADLSLKKLVSTTKPNVGDNITYTLEVSNAGPSVATNVQVRDVLPAGLTLVSSTDFTLNVGVLTSKNIPQINVGDKVSLTFVANVTGSAAITNKAEISKADQIDPDSQPNSGTEDGQDDTDKVTIIPQHIDLSLDKAISAGPYNIGDVVTYTLTITNGGPDVATNIEVKDVLPTTLSFVSSDVMTNTNGTVKGFISSLANGNSVSLTFKAELTQAAATNGGIVTNKAEISKADQFDGDSQPNSGTQDGQDDTDSVTVTIQKAADLSLTKTVDKTSPNVNDIVTFSITVNNAGPDAATNVIVRDVLPNGLEFVSGNDFSAVSNDPKDLRSVTIAKIEANSSKTLIFKARVTAQGQIINRAEVFQADQFDPDSQPGNGTANGEDDTGGVALNGKQADLSLSKAVNNPNPNLNDEVIYTIVVSNAGADAATNVQVRDVLPAGLSFVSSSDFVNANGTLTSNTIGSIANGASVSLTFKAKVTQPGTIINKAEISKADQFDPDSQPNTGTEDGQDDTDDASLTVQQADLSLQKIVNNASPIVGSNVVYTLKVTNAGPSVATNVQVKDLLPTGLEFVSSADFSNSNGTLTANIPSLAVGVTKELNYTAKVTQSGTIINRAEISKSDQYDPDSTPNNGTNNNEDDQAQAAVGGQLADLSLTKVVSDTLVNPNQEVVYKIVVSNAGPSVATNVQVKDALPAGIQFVSSNDFTNTSGTLLSKVIASIAANKADTLRFVAKVVGNGSIVNKAEISKADQPDPDSTPNNGTDNNEDDTNAAKLRVRQSDLSLVKKVSKNNPNVDENITYTLTVSNAGPDDATGVQVKDVIPSGIELVSSNDFTNTNGTLLSNLVNVGKGQSINLSFVAKVTQTGVITNKAEISKADQYDPDSQPNTGTEDGQDDVGSVSIGGQQADLSLSKSVNNASPNLNDEAIYTITVSNAGPSAATNVQVRDVLPVGLSFVSSSDFVNANGTLTSNTIGSIANGASVSLTFKAKVTQPGTIINKAEISKADQFDPDSQPNTGTEDGQDDTGRVSLKTQEADLSLKKTASTLVPTVGSNVTYTLEVSNAGPNVATNVAIRDVLPTGLEFVSSTDFTKSSDTLVAKMVSLAPGTSKAFTYVAKVTKDGAILNKAEVTNSDQYDPDSKPNNGTDNSEDDRAQVAIGGQLADLSLSKAVSDSLVNQGGTVTYTLTVHNAGPSAATTIEVKDVLPAGIVFVNSNDFTQISTGTLVAKIAKLEKDALTTVSFTAKVTGSGTIINKAQISASDQPDPDSTPDNGTDNKEDDTSLAKVRVLQADLSLTKLVNQSSSNVNSQVVYSLVVKNNGPDAATNVTVKDVLPQGLSYIASTDFTLNAGVLFSRNIGNLAPNATDTLRFIAKVISSGAILNKAEISKADQFDPDSQPNTGTEDGQDDIGSVMINGQLADLSLSKKLYECSPTPNIGDTVGYVIEIRNAGPGLATNIRVRDYLPAGLEWISTYNNDFSLVSDGVLQSRNISSLAVGNSLKLYVKAKVTGVTGEQACCGLMNTAEIYKVDQEDPDSQPASGTDDGQDDTDKATVKIQKADLSLKKTVSNAKPSLNEQIIYTLTVNNAGPNVATNVEVKDVLPAGLTFVQSSDVTNSNGTLTGKITSIAPGTNASLNFVVKVTNSSAILNKAEITKADQFDPDSKPNNGTDNGEDDAAAVLINGKVTDLELTKVANTTIPKLGETITYSLIIKNKGTDPASGVQITDKLPTGVKFVESFDLTHFAGTLKNLIPVSIAAGDSVVIQYNAQVIKPGTWTNFAEIIKSNEYDSDSKPNTGFVDGQDDTDSLTIVTQHADLSLVKAVNIPNSKVGDLITFTLTVSNAGPFAATNVEVTDLLPPGLQFVSSPEVINNVGMLTMTVDKLEAGQSKAWSFVAKVTKAGTLINRAEVTKSDQYDPDSTPNNGVGNGEDDEARLAVNGGLADLSLEKRVNKLSAPVGEQVTFRLTVRNAGPNTARNVEVKDVLPTDLQFMSSNDLRYKTTTRTLTGLIDSIPANQQKTLYFVAKLLTTKAVTNKAEVSFSEQYDPDSTPNNGTDNGEDDADSITVNGPKADLSLEKLVDNAEPKYGETVTFTLKVSNAGPGLATKVEVKDKLPQGLAFVSSNAITVQNDSLVARFNTIPAGESRSVQFVAKVTGVGLITNKAEVTDVRQADPDSEPNTGTNDGQDDVGTTNLFGRAADLEIRKSVEMTNVYVYDTLTYTLRVRNKGVATAKNIEITDKLPAGLSFVSGENITAENGIVKMKVSELQAGNTKACSYKVVVIQEGSLTNVATITGSDLPDLDSKNNTDSVTVKAVHAADLAIQKTAANDSVAVGKFTTFTIKVKNLGKSIAHNIEFYDQLPYGLVYQSGSNWTVKGDSLMGKIAQLAVGEEQAFSFVAKVIAPGAIVNKAIILKAKEVDPISKNNTAEFCVKGYEVPKADLSLVKIASVPKVALGDTLKFTLTIKNNGPDAAKNIEIRDVLPKQFAPVSRLESFRNDTLLILIPELAKGATMNFGFSVKTMKVGTWTNFAEISKSGTQDPDSEPNNGFNNNEDDWSSAKVEVVYPCDTIPLAVTCSAKSVCAGEKVTLTATGCSGTLKWSNGQKGNSITVSPLETTTYSVVCEKPNCEALSSREHTIMVNKAEVPVLSCQKPSVCLGESVTIQATGCNNGTIVWSTGKTGTSITVSPTETSQFTAICQVNDCKSETSKVLEIKVLSAATPTITCSNATLCAGESVTLKASGCNGTVIWSTGATGLTLTVSPQANTDYFAYCAVENCKSANSNILSVTVNKATKPVITSNKESICVGDNLSLSASGCTGTVVWNTGAQGNTITVAPLSTASYTATCKVGDCTAVSDTKVITVQSVPVSPVCVNITNICPAVAADLRSAVKNQASQGGVFEFYTSATRSGQPLARPDSVGTGTYYVVEKSTSGCYSPATKIEVVVHPCSSDLRITKTIDNTTANKGDEVLYTITVKNVAGIKATNVLVHDVMPAGLQFLSSSSFNIQNGVLASLIPSIAVGDSVKMTVLAKAIAGGIWVNTAKIMRADQPDPVSTNNAASATLTVTYNNGKPLLGVSKTANLPVKFDVPGKEVYEVSYDISISNMGDYDLGRVQVEDDLGKVFDGTGVTIVNNSIQVTAESGLVANKSYTGKGLLVKLLDDSLSTLKVGETRRVNIKFKADFSLATTSTFLNTALAKGYANINDGYELFQDLSTNGINPDPDADGNPLNNNTPTPLNIVISNRAAIGVALMVKDTVRQVNGSYKVTYQYVLKNYGNVDLKNVQLTDTLSATFDNVQFEVMGTPRTGQNSLLKVNPRFGKLNDYQLLTLDSQLPVGKVDTVWISVNVAGSKRNTPYINVTFVSAETNTGTKVADQSTDGSNPDPDGNLEPSEAILTLLLLPSLPDEIFIPEGFSPNGDGVNDVFVIRNVPSGTSVNLQVFNRWGNLVYAQEEYRNDWGGEPNTGVHLGNGGVPDGTYFYLVKLSDGRQFVRYITISR